MTEPSRIWNWWWRISGSGGNSSIGSSGNSVIGNSGSGSSGDVKPSDGCTSCSLNDSSSML